MVDDCYSDAVRLLREHRDRLEQLANELLARETLDEHDAYRAAGIVHPDEARRAAGGERRSATVVPAAAGGSNDNPDRDR